jgi:hypothetical protein
MWHQFQHSCKTMPNKEKKISFFNYIQTTINILIIFVT